MKDRPTTLNLSRRSAMARGRGFTLIEILLSTAILAILMLVSVSALDQVIKSWRYSQGKVEQFRESRVAFEMITRNLSQATLNTYWDYFYKDASSPPAAYVRQSELQFQIDSAIALLGAASSAKDNPGHALFFQAPLGLSPSNPGLGQLLNARGYYVQFGDDSENRPVFINERGVPLRYRYRLMEYRPPAERISTGPSTFEGDAIYVKPENWFQADLKRASHVVAENVLLFILSPRVSDEVAVSTKRDTYWLAPYYTYNSLDGDNFTKEVEKIKVSNTGIVNQGTQHLLPPLVQVTMVAIDEPSAQRWEEKLGDRAVDILSESGASFKGAGSYDSDLAKLKDYLSAQKLNYRVFTSTVALRNAKWDGRKS